MSTLLLSAVIVVCAGLLLYQPRSVVLGETPPLVLPEAPVRQALAADAKAAAQSARTKLAAELDQLWLELGRAEHDGDEPMPRRRDRRSRAAQLYRDVVKESGEAGALGLRAAAVERLEDALDLKLNPELARDVMGDFAILLEREECARDGELIAPMFVVRLLYKARWNIAHELPPDYQLLPIERRAYYGWQSLHARRLTPDQRLRALLEYQKSGGTRVDEAAAVLLHAVAETAAAHAALTRAYTGSGSLRLRNAMRAEAPLDE